VIERRPLGRTGLSVSALTLGTGGLAATAGEGAADAFAHAIAYGVDAVELAADDAAAAALVAPLLARERARGLHLFVRVAPLVPLPLPSPHLMADQVYPGTRLRAQVEGLLRTLRVERLAFVLLHAWSAEWSGEGDWLDTLRALRAEGKVAGFGPSLFDHDVAAGVAAVGDGTFDGIQALGNVFDPAALARLAPACAERGMAFLARSPFHYGTLAGSSGARWGDWRDDYHDADFRAEAAERAERLAHGLAAHDVALSEAALRFTAFAPGTTSVVMGLRTRPHVDAALAAVARGPLPPEVMAVLATERWLC
jgi:aryl-alcohol dehydrogenase-like predicted oxidoreductase